jgi:hypothetical protein
MPLIYIRGIRLSPEFLRNLFARASELSFRRGPSEFSHLVCIDLLHVSARRKMAFQVRDSFTLFAETAGLVTS